MPMYTFWGVKVHFLHNYMQFITIDPTENDCFDENECFGEITAIPTTIVYCISILLPLLFD